VIFIVHNSCGDIASGTTLLRGTRNRSCDLRHIIEYLIFSDFDILIFLGEAGALEAPLYFGNETRKLGLCGGVRGRGPGIDLEAIQLIRQRLILTHCGSVSSLGPRV
jgi:hypothetical protein